MKRWYWFSLAGVAGLGTVILIVIVLLPKPPISPHLQKQLTFTLFVPRSGQYYVNHDSAKYDSSLKLLSYVVPVQHNSVIVSEQPAPESFSDVPQAFRKVLDGMNDYSDFDTSVGTVHLTRPSSLHGRQAAVLDAQGTLLFAKPSEDLSKDQWRQFFNAFGVQR
jgi:hypothetical protein